MDPKDFLTIYREPLEGYASKRIENNLENIFLPKTFFYRNTDSTDVCLNTLDRSELLELIQNLALVERNERVTTQQINMSITRLKDEASRLAQEAAQSQRDQQQAQITIKQLSERLAAELRRRQAETQHLRCETLALRGTIEELKKSTSWRVTAPLRFLSPIMKKLKHLPHLLFHRLVTISRAFYRRLPLSLYQRTQIKNIVIKIVGTVPGPLSKTISVNSLAPAAQSYPAWHAARQALTPHALMSIQAAIAVLPCRPLLSIVMPVHNPPPKFLTAAVASVQAQLYEHWELCIADDASIPEVADLLREFARRDRRIQLIRLETNLGISGATNQALKLATGQWVGFLDHDDVLDPTALFFVASTLTKSPDTDVIYTDRDSVTAEDIHVDPYFKPDWSPLALLEHNYVIHFLVVRRTLLVELGGLRAEFDGAQDYDLVLRLAEHTDRVQHIPEILYSWRRHSGSNSGLPKPAAFEAGRRAISAALQRRGLNGTVDLVGPSGPYHVHLVPEGQPLISIIISSRNPKLLRACVEILRAKTTYPNIEILLATNAIGDTELRSTCDLLGLRRIEVENGFFSRMNNEAARAAHGEFVLFLNDDIEVITPDWIDILLALAQLPGVAAVGPRLVYPNGRTQLTRLVTGIRRDGRPYFFDPFDYYDVDTIFGFSLHVTSEVLGVSGGCMLTPRQLFLDSGGFEAETFSFSYQDADWALRVRATGQSMVFTPHAVLIHYGQFTKRDVPDMMSREIRLANAFFTLHQTGLTRGDPFWNTALVDVQGLLDPPCFPGQPRLSLPEVAPQTSHSLTECAPFRVEAKDLGTLAPARAACCLFADQLVKTTACRTLVDVGCGVGFLIEALVEQGIDAWGLDQSSVVVAAALPSVSDRVVLGALGSGLFSDPIMAKAPFDVAVCTALVERLPDDLLLAAFQQLANLAHRIVVITPKPNLWDRLDPTCHGLRLRETWLDLFRQVGLYEDRFASSALFGAGYDNDPDMTFTVLTHLQ